MTKEKQIIYLLFGAHSLCLIGGCVKAENWGAELRFDRHPYKPDVTILLNVKSLEVINESPAYRRHGFADNIDGVYYMPAWVNRDLQNLLSGTIRESVRPQGAQYKAVFRIKDAAIKQSRSPAFDNMAMVYVASLDGHKEQYTAFVEGVIEIEESGRIIDKAEFSVSSTVEEKTGTIEEMQRGIDAAGMNLLQALPGELDKTTDRYLSRYRLTHNSTANLHPPS